MKSTLWGSAFGKSNLFALLSNSVCQRMDIENFLRGNGYVADLSTESWKEKIQSQAQRWSF